MIPEKKPERIQKILAQAGVASSRRKAEEMIREGLIRINGKMAQLGDQATWGQDSIKVNNKLLREIEEFVYLAFYKPKNMISSFKDPQERMNLGEFFKKIKTRLVPADQIEFENEGLLLLTNDGNFIKKVQSAKGVQRTYLVKVKGFPTEEMISRIKKGMSRQNIHKKVIRPVSVRAIERFTQKSLIEVVTLRESASDLKLLFEDRGFLVEKITRKSLGKIELGKLKPKGFRILKPSEIQSFLKALE